MARRQALVPFCLAIGGIVAVSPSGSGQEEPQGDPTRLALETVQKWHETELALSQEAAQWEAEKASMTDLLALYRQELASLEELIRSAGESATEAEEKRVALVAEEAALEEAAARLGRLMTPLESALQRLLPLFPKPLQEAIAASDAQLPSGSEDSRLQDRVRNLLAILLEAEKFQRKVHLDREIRRFDGATELEVSVVYLGLSRAFFVDESADYAGVGYPTADGWRWETRPGLAEEIAAAVKILAGSPEKARYLDLPLQVKAVRKP